MSEKPKKTSEEKLLFKKLGSERKNTVGLSRSNRESSETHLIGKKKGLRWMRGVLRQ